MALPHGYNARKALPLYDFLTKYFPLALVELTKVSVVGNEQHNPGEPLHWARGKSMDQLNTAMRHIFDHAMGAVYDDDPDAPRAPGAFVPSMKTMHLAKAAWRLLAEIQLLCEARDAAPSEAVTDSRLDVLADTYAAQPRNVKAMIDKLSEKAGCYDPSVLVARKSDPDVGYTG